MADGNFGLGPVRKQVLEKAAADAPMQTADAIDVTAAADGQVGHVEQLTATGGVFSPQGQELVRRQVGRFKEGLAILCQQVRFELVKGSSHRSMRREDVA